MKRMALLGGALLALTSIPAETVAQTVRGIVLDQTGLPLPGATLQLFNGSTLIASVTTGADGSFAIENTLVGDAVTVSLDGFEPVRLPRGDAGRIVLQIAHARETTTVVAPTLAPSSPTTPLLGHTLTS